MISGRVENHNPRVQKNNSDNFFLKNQFLFWFSDFEQNSCKTFPEMLSAVFSQLTSLCPEEQIEKTSVLWKIQTFLSIPDFER